MYQSQKKNVQTLGFSLPHEHRTLFIFPLHIPDLFLSSGVTLAFILKVSNVPVLRAMNTDSFSPLLFEKVCRLLR